MATLHHLDTALINVRDRLTKELQFSVDAKRNVLQTIDTARHAIKVATERIDDVEAAVVSAFDERHRALATTLGTPGAQPETIEQPVDQATLSPRLVKKAAGGDA